MAQVRLDPAKRRQDSCLHRGQGAGLGQGAEGEMNRHEEDGLDDLGWLFSAVAALMFLFGSLVYTLHWMGLLQ